MFGRNKKQRERDARVSADPAPVEPASEEFESFEDDSFEEESFVGDGEAGRAGPAGAARADAESSETGDEQAGEEEAGEEGACAAGPIVSVEMLGSTAVATILTSELMGCTAEAFGRSLVDALKEAPAAEGLVVDFQDVEFIDSACLNMLIRLMSAFKEQGGRIAVASCRERVEGLFRLTRLDQLFPIRRSVLDAVAAVERQAA